VRAQARKHNPSHLVETEIGDCRWSQRGHAATLAHSWDQVQREDERRQPPVENQRSMRAAEEAAHGQPHFFAEFVDVAHCCLGHRVDRKGRPILPVHGCVASPASFGGNDDEVPIAPLATRPRSRLKCLALQTSDRR